MSKPDATKCAIPCVEVESTVLQQIRRHARSSMQAEICGVLIGGEKNGITAAAGMPASLCLANWLPKVLWKEAIFAFVRVSSTKSQVSQG